MDTDCLRGLVAHLSTLAVMDPWLTVCALRTALPIRTVRADNGLRFVLPVPTVVHATSFSGCAGSRPVLRMSMFCNPRRVTSHTVLKFITREFANGAVG